MALYIQDFRQDDSFTIKLRHDPTKDITGAVFHLTLKSTFESPTAALEIVHTVGDHVDDDASTGTVYIPVTKEQTSALAEGKYYYSIKKVLGTSVATIIPPIADRLDQVEVFPTLKEMVV